MSIPEDSACRASIGIHSRYALCAVFDDTATAAAGYGGVERGFALLFDFTRAFLPQALEVGTRNEQKRRTIVVQINLVQKLIHLDVDHYRFCAALSVR